MMTYGATNMAGWMIGWSVIEMTTVMLGALGALILIAFVLFKLNRAGLPRRQSAGDRSAQLLRERHERGQLSEKQYGDARHVLHDETHV